MSEMEEEAAVEAAPEEEAEETREEEPEETREEEPEDTPTPDLGTEVTGKRTKKTVARLEIQMAKPKEKLKVEDGGGDKLGDIPRTNHMIGKLKPGDLKPLHSIMFDRPGKTASMRKNMRQFNGFPFDVNSKQFTKKRDKLLRWSSLTNLKLRAICKVLDLEKKGSQVDLVNRILIFLSAPKNSGKPLLSKKKKKTKKRLSGGDSKSKPRPKSTSTSPKKTKGASKSKAIVMESSSDEEDDDEDDKAGAQAEEEEEEEEAKESGIEKSDESEDDGEEDDDEEEEEEDEAPKTKSPARKPAAGKRPRAPTKKSLAPRKRSRKVLSESESEADSEADEKPKKKAKRAAASKPAAAKSKKADSSSNSKKTNSTVSEESSDDDRPLIKMVRVAPSDEQLKATVQGLLKDADLEEITMKQICQRVYDTYPDHDLASRKDYIKQTVKSLIT